MAADFWLLLWEGGRCAMRWTGGLMARFGEVSVGRGVAAVFVWLSFAWHCICGTQSIFRLIMHN